MIAIEIRNKFLNYFKNHGHKIIPSAPLIPENDPSVLFTTAGMHPLVPYLLGEKHPEGTRLADYQKCLRTVDIDEVGDNRHLTFFEMLGNWSLGDYFKNESIRYTIEFLTKELNIPMEKLSVTCFAGDNDAPRDEETAKKKDLADQIQKFSMTQGKKHVLKIVILLVIVVNMLKFGIMSLWNIINTQTEHIQS